MKDPMQEEYQKALYAKQQRTISEYRKLPGANLFTLSPFQGLLTLSQCSVYVLSVDFETTSLDEKTGGLWEVGACLAKITLDAASPAPNIQELDLFSSLVRPHSGAIFDEETAKYHGFKSAVAMKRHAYTGDRVPEVAENLVASEFVEWVKTAVANNVPAGEIVHTWAHNAVFEEKFFAEWEKRLLPFQLDTEPFFKPLEKLGISFNRSTKCTRQFYKLLQFLGVADPSGKSSLANICKYYALKPKTSTAVFDAIATVEVLSEMLVTLRHAMGIYQAYQDMADETLRVLTRGYALGPKCTIIEPVYNAITEMYLHCVSKPQRAKMMILARDMNTPQNEIRLCIRPYTGIVHIANMTDERKTIVSDDPRYDPVCVLSYSQSRRLIIVRKQSERAISPVLALLAECIEQFVQDAFASVSDVRQKPIITRELSEYILDTLPDDPSITGDVLPAYILRSADQAKKEERENAISIRPS